jgi:dTDP-4-amino-4,6-dideoxygalactose transaminase
MFETVKKFEEAIADFYGAPYAVATDCCTHAIELCLRKEQPKFVDCPKYTYLSVPMTFIKLNISWQFTEEKWQDYYQIGKTRIYDAAVLWKSKSYITDSYMCLSFQYRKHLNLGRGGAILCGNKDDYLYFKKLSYDGRLPDVPWAEQQINTIGYHYYMTPETAQLGLDKLSFAIDNPSKTWDWKDYPDLSNMSVFNPSNQLKD